PVIVRIPPLSTSSFRLSLLSNFLLLSSPPHQFFFFFFNDPPTTEFSPLSLHDALPICLRPGPLQPPEQPTRVGAVDDEPYREVRSEEHTSELQSLTNLVCRLLLEKKKNNNTTKQKHKNKKREHNTDIDTTRHSQRSLRN